MWNYCLKLTVFCFTCGTIFCEADFNHKHFHEEHEHGRRNEIFEEISKHMSGASKQVNGDLLAKMDVQSVAKKTFHELNLVYCNGSSATCNTCFSKKDLLSWFNLPTNASITEDNLAKISVGVLYLLSQSLQQVSRQVGDVCKSSRKLKEFSVSHSEAEAKMTSHVFQTLIRKYRNGRNENTKFIDKKSLARLLQDVNKTVGNQLTSNKCFSAHDVIRYTGVSEDQIDEHDFEYVAGYILLQVLDGKCISANEEPRELPEAHFFVEKIFEHFGNATHMSSENFELIYNNLKLGKKRHGGEGDDHDDEEHEDEEHKHRRKRSTETNEAKCFDAEEILKIYSVSEGGYLDQQKFQQVCPSLIRQLETGACAKQTTKGEEKHFVLKETQSWKPWIGMFLSITVISLASLSGIFAAPLSGRKWFPYFIMYLISLAVAVLIGDAMLHLFPHAVGLHQHKPGEDAHAHHGVEEENPMLKADSFLWKSLCFLVGVYMFFMFEVFMHAFGGGHSHSHGMEEHVTSSSTNNSMKVKGTLRMSEDSVVYDLNATDSNIVTRPSGLHECTSEHSLSDEDLDTIETVASNSPEFSRSGSPSSQSMLMKKQSDTNAPGITRIQKSSGESHVSFKEFQSVAWMVLIGDAIHNFLDGIAIGVAFSESWPEGLHGGISTSIAILCHELPHELGDFAVLLNSGLSIKQALLMNFISSLTAYIGGVIGVSLGTQWAASSWVFAFTAGLFVYIALVDMLPEVLHSAILKLRPWFCIALASTGLWTGFGIMLVLGAWEEDIKSVLR